MSLNKAKFLKAYYYLQSIPSSEFDLAYFWTPSSPDDGLPCGCALGHLANSKEFDMFLDKDYIPRHDNKVDTYFNAAVASFGFSLDDAGELFKAPFASKYDELSWRQASTNKELWMMRAEAFLKEHDIFINDTKSEHEAEVHHG